MSWEWPKQNNTGVDVISVREMECNHNPSAMKSTVKLNSDTDRFYCLKCWEKLGFINDYIDGSEL